MLCPQNGDSIVTIDSVTSFQCASRQYCITSACTVYIARDVNWVSLDVRSLEVSVHYTCRILRACMHVHQSAIRIGFVNPAVAAERGLAKDVAGAPTTAATDNYSGC